MFEDLADSTVILIDCHFLLAVPRAVRTPLPGVLPEAGDATAWFQLQKAQGSFLTHAIVHLCRDHCSPPSCEVEEVLSHVVILWEWRSLCGVWLLLLHSPVRPGPSSVLLCCVQEDVQSLLKTFQLSTRQLHHMCGHSKVSLWPEKHRVKLTTDCLCWFDDELLIWEEALLAQKMIWNIPSSSPLEICGLEFFVV